MALKLDGKLCGKGNQSGKLAIHHAVVGKRKKSSTQSTLETARLSGTIADTKTASFVKYQRKKCNKMAQKSRSDKSSDESDTDDDNNPLRIAFDKIKEHYDSLPMSKLYDVMTSRGICPNEDPRLSSVISSLEERYKGRRITDIVINYRYFRNITKPIRKFMIKMIDNKLAISDVDDWIRCIGLYYEAIKEITGEELVISLTSTDGQRIRWGKTDTYLTMSEHMHIIIYMVALEKLGYKTIHETVGLQPKTSSEWTPENPLEGAGALAVTAHLVSKGWTDISSIERIKSMKKWVSDLAGEIESQTQFNYLVGSERKKEYLKALLSWIAEDLTTNDKMWDIDDIVQFYMECLSIQITADGLSSLGATLANGGVSVLRGRKLFCSGCVEKVLAVMTSTSKKPGVPIMASSSGTTFVVVPSLFGLVVNSKNYKASCLLISALFRHYALNPYERIFLHTGKTPSICRCVESSLFLTAKTGDVFTLASLMHYGVALYSRDYMCRTILHVAAALGHLTYVRFLVNYCPQLITSTDIMGRTPLDDADEKNQIEIKQYLENLLSDQESRKSVTLSSRSTVSSTKTKNSC